MRSQNSPDRNGAARIIANSATSTSPIPQIGFHASRPNYRHPLTRSRCNRPRRWKIECKTLKPLLYLLVVLYTSTPAHRMLAAKCRAQ